MAYSAAEITNGDSYTVTIGGTVAEATAGEVSQGMGGGPMSGQCP
ncbi:MAG: hypothetical protein E6689_05800 [Corynebacterium striatum]|nr:hypothetical protein [Corynebacterium simulans]MDU3174927.1 hypothetical protein [Corynebacterium striatum]